MLHTKDALRVVPSFLTVHISLVGKKRGALHEENSKGSQEGIPHFILLVVSSGSLIW
jgi:hypothetical protein